jgi:hypothetical protein
MAESDGKPASSPLSSEEADRLSERFRPSWEAEPDPPTIPKADPPAPAVVVEPAANVEPAVAVEPAANVEPAVVVEPALKVEPTVKVERARVSEPPAKPAVRVEPMIKLEPAAKAAPAPNLKQTLLGIPPPEPSKPPSAVEKAPADELDWEVPAEHRSAPKHAVPAAAAPAVDIEVPIDIEPAVEPPPKSSPSGVGQKYEPKDAGAPPIVLTDELKRAEETARAQLAAEHQARSAPTLLKLKAVELGAKPAPPDDDIPDFVPKKRGLGVWLALGAALVLAVGGTIVASGSRKAPEKEAPAPDTKAAARLAPEPPTPPTAPPTPAPTTEAAADAQPVVAPSEPERPIVSPRPAAEPTTTPAAQPPSAPKTTSRVKPVVASKPAPQPRSAQTASKPASTTSKPVGSKPAAGGIVRDAPF